MPRPKTTFTPPTTPATPPGVPIPYPNLMSAAKTGAPVFGSIRDLLGAMRAGMPYGPLAAMPAHYKSALHANGIPTPTGPAALAQQTEIVHLAQKAETIGESAEQNQLAMQQAMERLARATQMLSNVQKKQRDTAQAIIGNIR